MGSVVPDQTAEVVVDTPSLAVVDGKFGYGQTVTPQAVQDRHREMQEGGPCRRSRCAMPGISAASATGRRWPPPKDWCRSISSTPRARFWSRPMAASRSGCRPRPIASAFRAQGQDPIVLDFATSIVAEGKVLVASRGGKKLPKGALVDADGTLSEDPAVLYGPLHAGRPARPHQGHRRDPRVRRAQGLGAGVHLRTARRRADRDRRDRGGPALRQRHARVLCRPQGGRHQQFLRRRNLALSSTSSGRPSRSPASMPC